MTSKNLQNITPCERATIIRKLHEAGVKPQDIAARFGLSTKRVQDIARVFIVTKEETIERKCLKCLEVFPAPSRFIRLCPQCSRSADVDLHEGSSGRQTFVIRS